MYDSSLLISNSNTALCSQCTHISTMVLCTHQLHNLWCIIFCFPFSFFFEEEIPHFLRVFYCYTLLLYHFFCIQRTFNRIDLLTHRKRVSRLRISIVVIIMQALRRNKKCRYKQVEMCMH